MEFLVKRVNKLSWYYSVSEMLEQINQVRSEHNLDTCSEDLLKGKIEYIKIGDQFLKIENSAGSYYCMKEKKQVITFDVKTEHIQLIEFQMQGLLNFVVEELGRNKRVSFDNVVNHANYLEDYLNKKNLAEEFKEKYPEKNKASNQKPKKI